MNIEDYDEVYTLWERTEGVGLNESDSRERVGSYLRKNPGMSFTAVEDGRIIGAVLCGDDGRRGYVHHLAVDPACRGRGIGTKLLDECIRTLENAGIQKCNVFVYAENDTGKEFWKSRDWVSRDDLMIYQKVLEV